MTIYCPLCHEQIDHGDDTLPEHVLCPSCGSTLAVRQHAAAIAARAAAPRRLGRFELLEVIGYGAFGTVYKARDPELDRLVAVKVPHPGESAAAAGRFLREARSAAQLRHPAIVPIHEAGEDQDTPFLVSELVAGATLADCLHSRRFGPAEAARLIATLADALDYAHTKGVIHRDVKPTNVMIDAAGEPHLLDFGLALRDAGEVTMTTEGQVLGTPGYMSPEQARGEGHAVDGRTDVYSLGAILYLMLTGEPPFRGNVRMVLRQVLEEDPRPPRRLNDRVPRDLETVCLKCLDKEPGRRYGSAAALADDLHRFLAGRPVLARPVPLVAKAGRWCRRNPALAGALTAVFLALAAVAAVSLEFAHSQAENARNLKVVNEELQQTDARRRQALRQATYLARDRGLALCEQGEADLGLLWLARALEIGPEDDPELAEGLQEVRAQFGAWQGRVCPPLTDLAPAARVDVLTFSPDGRLLLTGSRDGPVTLWRTATGEMIGNSLSFQGAGAIVVFSRNGRRFAATGWNGPVHVGDAATGQAIGAPIPHRGGDLLAISPDGKLIANLERPESVRLWDVDPGRLLGDPIRPGGEVRAVAFSPDGKLLVTGGRDGKARFWDTATGQSVGKSMAHQGAIYGAVFSPDGKTLLTWGEDRTARLWDPATSQARGTPLGHQQPVRAAAFSPDGLLIATGSGEQPEKGEVRVWDVAAARQVGMSMSHPTAVREVAFSHDGGVVLTRCQDGLARFWEAASGRPLGGPLRHAAPLTAAVFSPDGARVATADESGVLRLWGVVPYRPPGATITEGRRVAGVAFSPDGRLLVTGGWDRTARVWDVATGRQVGETMDHPDVVLGVAFSRDGRTILTGCRDKVARLWNAATQRPTGPVFKHEGSVVAVAFGPGDTIVTGCHDHGARLWDATSGKTIGALIDCGTESPAVAVSPDGKFVLTNGPHPGAHLWDATNGRPAGGGFPHPGLVLALAFSPDGRDVLTGGIDRTARRWDAATGAALSEPLTHAQPVSVAAFSGDGQRLATGGWEGNVRLWEATGRAFGPQLPHALNSWVWSVALNSDGTMLATGAGAPFDGSGEGRLWPLPAPATGSSERIVVATRVHTGLDLDEDGVAHLLDAAALEQARRRLEELDTAGR